MAFGCVDVFRTTAQCNAVFLAGSPQEEDRSAGFTTVQPHRTLPRPRMTQVLAAGFRASRYVDLSNKLLRT